MTRKIQRCFQMLAVCGIGCMAVGLIAVQAHMSGAIPVSFIIGGAIATALGMLFGGVR